MQKKLSVECECLGKVHSVDELISHLDTVLGTGALKPKCKTCSGMGYLAQLTDGGEDFDTIPCPQCSPEFNNES